MACNPKAQKLRLIDNIEFMLGCDDPQMIFDHLCECVGRFGFDKIVMGQALITDSVTFEDRRFFYQKGLSEFLVIYLKEMFQFSDPIALRAIGSHRPFRWREAHVDMTPKQKQQIEIANSHGLEYGIMFPIIDRPGPVGFVSMGQPEDFDLQGLDFIEVEMLIRYGFYAIDQKHSPEIRGSNSTLSAREISVLMLVAKGKTNWEVGQILGVSEYSVRDYLKGISKRLETSNRTHTVVRAIQLGLILP